MNLYPGMQMKMKSKFILKIFCFSCYRDHVSHNRIHGCLMQVEFLTDQIHFNIFIYLKLKLKLLFSFPYLGACSS